MAEIASLLREGATRLADTSESPRLDAELLLAHALRWPRSRLYARPETVAPAEAAATFTKLLQRRTAGEPVAYLLGEQEFWSLPLTVSPACLVPRPETEGLVEWLLEDPAPQASIVDLGSGSGAIALAIKHERPTWTVTAVERSPAALALARENAARHRLEIRWQSGSWFEPLAGDTFDWVVSNPPYVAAGDPHLTALRHEPAEALRAGPDGLEDLRRIIATAPSHLRPGGRIALEHGHEQGAAVRQLLDAAGFDAIETRRDLAGHERLSGGRLA